MTRRWRSALVLATSGLLIGALLAVDGSPLAGLAVFVVFALVAALVSPAAFPGSVTDAAARAAQASDGHPIIYWRPGCPFCLRLRTALARAARDYHWVDIWSDPSGAATVRSIADGNETVPTVVTPQQSYVNPSPHLVRGLI
ncbi:MAG TPA: glutaredoxin domain-containing protein [Actinoplanes sp.]|nr:glutaredoxin domain-containing protein [Actinoplanes sp.]